MPRRTAEDAYYDRLQEEANSEQDLVCTNCGKTFCSEAWFNEDPELTVDVFNRWSFQKITCPVCDLGKLVWL